MTTTSEVGSAKAAHGHTTPTQVVLVEMTECHLCEQAKESLRVMGQQFDLDVTLVQAASPEGQRLIALHRPTMAPLVLLDGQFFSSGRLPRHKLADELRARADAAGNH